MMTAAFKAAISNSRTAIAITQSGTPRLLVKRITGPNVMPTAMAARIGTTSLPAKKRKTPNARIAINTVAACAIARQKLCGILERGGIARVQGQTLFEP